MMMYEEAMGGERTSRLTLLWHRQCYCYGAQLWLLLVGRRENVKPFTFAIGVARLADLAPIVCLVFTVVLVIKAQHRDKGGQCKCGIGYYN
jgi:hypothetical protein